MWLATQARPDIASAVRAVAKYCARPRDTLEDSIRCFIVCLGNEWLRYYFSEKLMNGLLMSVFADADYASKATNRRSVSG